MRAVAVVGTARNGYPCTISVRTSIEGYEIELVVASGGGGGVLYRARDRRLDRPVAIRVVSPEVANDPLTRARLNRECTVLAEMDHPNVVPLYDVGETDGYLYIVTRWLDGVDLATFVEALHPLDVARAGRLVLQVSAAIQAAHDRGVLHRATKPSNVLVARGNHAYVTDFGMARRSTDSTGLTPSHHLVESLDHLAPEHISGGQVDERTDVYGLGCTLYHALADEVPFPGTSYTAKLYAVLSSGPPSVRERRPEVPAALEAAICRAMAKEPGERQPSAAAFAEEVAAAAELTPPPWIPRSGGPRAPAPVDEQGPQDPREQAAESPPKPDLQTAELQSAPPGGPSPPEAGEPGVPFPTEPMPSPRQRRDLPPAEEAPQPSKAPDRPRASLRLGKRVLLLAGLLVFLAVPAALTFLLRERDAGARTVHVAPAASAVAVSADTVWVAIPGQSALRASDTSAADAAARSVPVEAPVSALAASPEGVVAAGDELVEVSDRNPESTERTPLPAPAGAVTAGEDATWAALADRPVLVRVAGKGASRIPLSGPASALDASDGILWVADAKRGTVLAVEESTGAARGKRIEVGGRPVAISATPGGIWVALAGQDALVRLDPRSGRKSGPPVPLAGEPSAVAADARHVWVARREDDAVTKIDARSGRTLEEVGTAREPVSVALSPDAAWIVGARGDLTRVPR